MSKRIHLVPFLILACMCLNVVVCLAQPQPRIDQEIDPQINPQINPQSDLPAAAAAAVDSLSGDNFSGEDTPPEMSPVIELLPEEPDYWTTGVSSTAAVLMTPLFPGWGQLYTDNSWRGALAFGVEMFYWTNLLVRDRRAVRAKEFSLTFPEDNTNRDYYDAVAQENWEQMRDFAWWSGGVLLIIALDSYVGAHLFNFDSDAVPVPNDWEGQFGGSGFDSPLQTEGPSVVVFQHGWQF